MNTTSPRDYSFIAPVYDHLFHRPLSEGHREIGELVKQKCKKADIKILEIGVGSGLTIDYMPKDMQYLGIDINEKMLSQAKAKARLQKRAHAEFHVMDARRLQLKDNSYDLVIAASVLTAMDSPLKGMREMIRVTKKGGHIAVIANLRRNDSFKSEMVKWFDPITRRYLGFRTDLSLERFKRFRELKLIEVKPVNTLLGFNLSSYMLFEKRI